MANVNFMTLAVWRLFCSCIAENVELSIFDIILTQFNENSLFFLTINRIIYRKLRKIEK